MKREQTGHRGPWTRVRRARVRWTIVATVILGLGVVGLHLATVLAAPLKVPKGAAESNEPKFRAAVYVPGTVVVMVLPPGASNGSGQPRMMLTALMEVEIAIPGRTDVVTKETLSVMSLDVDSLEKFPTPLELLDAPEEPDLIFFRVDSEDSERGLTQIRKIRKMATELYAELQAGEQDEQ